MSDKKELLTQLEQLLGRVPPSILAASWNRSVAYKDWVVSTRKIINKGRASEQTLRSLIETYKNF